MTPPGPVFCRPPPYPASFSAGVSSKCAEGLGLGDPPCGQVWGPGEGQAGQRAHPAALSPGGSSFTDAPASLAAISVLGLPCCSALSSEEFILPISVHVTVLSLPCAPSPAPTWDVPFSIPTPLPSPGSTTLSPCADLPCPKASSSPPSQPPTARSPRTPTVLDPRLVLWGHGFSRPVSRGTWHCDAQPR